LKTDSKQKNMETGNTLRTLNDQLFNELDRLSNSKLKGEALQEEITRAKAVNEVATQIISNGKLVLDARKAVDDNLRADKPLPKMLEG